MREVVGRIVEAEQEARRLVASASLEASRIAAEAERDAQQTLARGRDLARSEGDALVRQAIEQAERERSERLAELDAELETILQLDEPRKREAVAAVVRCVCTAPCVRSSDRTGGAP